MDENYFLENVNCKICKYFIICPHTINKKDIFSFCYYFVNQKNDFPKKDGG